MFDSRAVARFDVFPLTFYDGKCVIEILLNDILTVCIIFAEENVQMLLTVGAAPLRKGCSKSEASDAYTSI